MGVKYFTCKPFSVKHRYGKKRKNTILNNYVFKSDLRKSQKVIPRRREKPTKPSRTTLPDKKYTDIELRSFKNLKIMVEESKAYYEQYLARLQSAK